MSASTHQQPLFSSPAAMALTDTALVRDPTEHLSQQQLLTVAGLVQSHWLCKGTALFLPLAVREENGCGATCRSFDSPWKGPGLFCTQVWSRFEGYRALHGLPLCPAAGWLEPWTHVRELKQLNCSGFVWFFCWFGGFFYSLCHQ